MYASSSKSAWIPFNALPPDRHRRVGLGIAPVVAAAGASALKKITGGITFSKSPRYGGGDGPLYSTVNAFVDRIATGDLGVIQQLNTLRRNDADRVQWEKFWRELLPQQPLTAQQSALIKQLDPSAPAIAPRTGTRVYASPGAAVTPTAPPILRDIVEVARELPVVKQAEQEYVRQVVDEKTQQAGAVARSSVLPLVLGAAAALLLLKK